MKLFFLTIATLQFFLKNSQGGQHLLIETKDHGGHADYADYAGYNDYANTFSVGKSYGRVQQNNYGGDQHKLNVGHVGSTGKVHKMQTLVGMLLIMVLGMHMEQRISQLRADHRHFLEGTVSIKDKNTIEIRDFSFPSTKSNPRGRLGP